MRECGECQLCCEVLGVRQIQKAPDQKCAYQCKNGCQIYQIRPQECRDFSCAWLKGEVPEELKPNVVHAFLGQVEADLKKQGIFGTLITVHCDPANLQAYKEGALKDYLNAILATGTQLLILQPGEERYMRWGTVDES